MSEKRAEQMQSVLKRAADQVLARGLADPRIKGLITVTRVQMSGDMKRADVFVSVMPESAEDLTMHGLRHAARHIRRQMAEHVAIHQMPQIDFKVDTALKKQTALHEALSMVRADREARGLPPEPTAEELAQPNPTPGTDDRATDPAADTPEESPNP